MTGSFLEHLDDIGHDLIFRWKAQGTVGEPDPDMELAIYHRLWNAMEPEDIPGHLASPEYHSMATMRGVFLIDAFDNALTNFLKHHG